MTREELKVHCEKQIENCEMWATYKGEEPHGKIYEEHKLILELLEQEPILDKIRAEIIAKDRYVKSIRSDGRCFFIVEEVLDIIDKYKAEIEPQESEDNNG